MRFIGKLNLALLLGHPIFQFHGTVLHHCGVVLLVNIAFLLPASHTLLIARYMKGLHITSNLFFLKTQAVMFAKTSGHLWSFLKPSPKR